ncbi:MAG TPA: HAD family hydrolase, partial [Polyangiales bacterium]|nr:HAD family hydrolase [Polyangiales bacterium]
DGTLIDSVYQHVRIWHDVLAERGFVVPHWKVHRGVGLPSERLMLWLLGEEPEASDAIVAAHDDRFAELAGGLRPTPGAPELLAELERLEVPFCAVTSAGDRTREALFKALGRSMPYSKAASKLAPKPSPSPLLAAAESLRLEPSKLIMVGDAIWDGEAARRAGIPFIGLRCGGTSDALLRQAGALWVEDAPRDLMGRLG